MIIREKPSNIENYIAIEDSELNNYLQQKSFIPLYIYNNNIYFAKSKEIIKVVEKWKRL